MIKALWTRHKKVAIAGLFTVWAGVLLLALWRNPTDSDSKLTVMNQTADALLRKGGVVLERKSNAKYGGAFISLMLSEQGWSNDLVRAYEAALQGDGWTKNAPLSYCKDGVLLDIRPAAGVREGVTVNHIGLTYNASTLQSCSSGLSLPK